MSINIIFLDIDGVLNKGLVSSASPAYDVIKLTNGWMNKSLVANLNRFTTLYDSKLVISSSWRYEAFQETKEALLAFGITGEIISQTPELDSPLIRGDEIKAWLQDNEAVYCEKFEEYNNYLIVDDCDCILPEQKPHFVKTDPYQGFTLERLSFAKSTLESLSNSSTS